jgi:hypothetical protein
MRLSYRDTGIKNKIALFLDNSNKTEPKAFHCSGCGYVVFQYYSDQTIMVAGEGPRTTTSSPTVTIQCHNNQCKLQYDIFRS